jgi:hypothetical protein
MFDLSGYKPNTRKSLGAFILVVALLFSFSIAATPPDKEKHSSTREGGTIRMEPSGPFQIPTDWDSVRIEQTELREVRRGKREWSTEYTVVANAALPFSDCSVQAGRWDWRVSTFAGVTMRGYVTNRRSADVERKIATKALSAAKALPSPTIRIMKVPPLAAFPEARLGDGKPPTAEHALAAYSAYVAYFGTYTLDAEKSVVTHHVEGSLAPDFTGTDQPRPFKVEGDRLEIGDGKTWRRVLERVR